MSIYKKKKEEYFSKFGSRFLTAVEKNCPEMIRGDTEQLRSRLSVKYAGEKLEEAVRTCQRRNMQICVLICFVIILSAAAVTAVSIRDAESLRSISRPERGKGKISVPVIVEARRGDLSVEGVSNLIINEEKLSDREKDVILDRFSKELPDMVCPIQNGKRIVTPDFRLPSEDGEEGIHILWETSDPVLISSDGSFDVLALAEEEESVTLTAVMTLEGREKEISFDVILRDEDAMYRESLTKKLRELSEELSAGETGETVALPESLGDEIDLCWKAYDTGSTGWILLSGVTLAILFFFARYSFAEREIRRYRQGIIKNFPSFIDKLVLLLNSGLTVLAAMEKMAEDCEEAARYDKRNTLAYEAAEIGRKVRETNASLTKEWRKFAARTGIHEILRFSTIIEDNIGKGISLAEKLEAEGDLLREKEKKSLQEKMRMIDTKLTLPLILMLFSLVLVTVAPAMMQM